MKTNLKYILPVVLALASFSITVCSKERIAGNGNLISENRNASAFSRIISRGDIYINIIPDSVNSITVEAGKQPDQC